MAGIVETIKQQIQALNDIAAKVDAADLCQLAKMHEYAEEMEKQCVQAGETVGPLVRTVCRKIAQANEDIILEQCPDAEAALNTVRGAIGHLAELTLEPDNSADVDLLEKLVAELNISDQADRQTEQEQSAPDSPPETADEIELAPLDYTPQPLMIAGDEIEYIKSFLAESQEHLEAVETALLSIEQSPDDLDQINELFRPFHTIKGMAGFLNLKDINTLTHAVETLLDLARKGKFILTSEMIDVIFETVDVLKVQIGAVGQYAAQPTGQPVPQPPITDLLQKIYATVKGKPSPQAAKASEEPAARLRTGELLVEDERTTSEIVDFALEKQAAGEDKPVGQILTDMGAVKPRDVDLALRKQKGMQETVIRVDTAKLDNLINMVGELTIAQAQVEQSQVDHSDAALAAGRFKTLVDEVTKITREVQEIAMSLRMVPIASTFHKMGRVARDISRKGGKQIDFVVEGEDTELDKNVIQEISDPLMHMVRNAVDHGVEIPEVRIQQGKPAKGTVKLNAYHQGGNIVIEVGDDGKGLDKAVLLQKGIDKGLVDPNVQLTEQQIYQLVMTAGFSTAEKVTDVSGRGVGMDVVKRNIEKLRGKVEIRSNPGQGSTFVIRLPLTLAVIDGMVVRAGDRKFIIPTLVIHQALVPTAEQITTVQGRANVLNLRGELYTIISLAETFGIENAATDPTQGMVVILQAEGTKVGIVLDELLGQQQVVVKSLGRAFRDTRGISGGAILGDGTVGLILEPTGLLEIYQHPSPGEALQTAT